MWLLDKIHQTKENKQSSGDVLEKHSDEMVLLHNLNSCLFFLFVCASLSLSLTHTQVYVYIPYWKPISSWVSRGERVNDSHILPGLERQEEGGVSGGRNRCGCKEKGGRG